MLKQKCIGIVLLTVCGVSSSFGQNGGTQLSEEALSYEPLITYVSEGPVSYEPTVGPPVASAVVPDVSANHAQGAESPVTSLSVADGVMSYDSIAEPEVNYMAMADVPMGYDRIGSENMVNGPMNHGPVVEGPMNYDPMGQGDFEFIQSSVNGEYIQVPSYETPTVKFTFDGLLLNRVGKSEDGALVRTEPFGPPAISSSDIGFERRLGGKAELVFFAEPHRFSPRASVLWTGTELSKADFMAPEGSTADVRFFQARAADPSPGYTLRNRSRFTFADIGLRRGVSPAYGFSASLAYARIVESMDWISRGAAEPAAGGGNVPVGETGFFSQVDNRMYGIQVGADAQIWTNGYLKLDGNVSVGYFYNDVKAGAQALNGEQEWNPSNEAIIGMANLSLVIPADPVNIRIGYQGAFLSGVALPGSYTRDLSIFDGSGAIPSDDVWYHGLMFGIEYLR